MTPQKPSEKENAANKPGPRTTTRATQEALGSVTARMVCNQVAANERVVSLAPIEGPHEDNEKTYKESKGGGQVYLQNLSDEALRMFKLNEEYTVEITPAE